MALGRGGGVFVGRGGAHAQVEAAVARGPVAGFAAVGVEVGPLVELASVLSGHQLVVLEVILAYGVVRLERHVVFTLPRPVLAGDGVRDRAAVAEVVHRAVGRADGGALGDAEHGHHGREVDARLYAERHLGDVGEHVDKRVAGREEYVGGNVGVDVSLLDVALGVERLILET